MKIWGEKLEGILMKNMYGSCIGKVEIFLEQREVAFLSPSKICGNLNFSSVLKLLLL